MYLAVVQLNSQSDVAHNLERVRVRVAEAASRGATLIALPENFAFMGPEQDKRAIAENIEAPGPITKTLRDLASSLRITLVAGGMPERSDDPERPYNTSLLVTEAGVVARYRKIHLFDVDLADGTSLRESRATQQGEVPVVADVGEFRLGMTICYDLRFPELFRANVDRGAEIITVPAAFTLTTGKDHWHVLLRARAIENQVYVVAPAQHGQHTQGRTTYGKSVVIDPWGDVLAQCPEGEGIALAHVDREYLHRVRKQLPCLAHRRLR